MSAYDYLDLSDFFIDEFTESCTYSETAYDCIRYAKDATEQTMPMGESIDFTLQLLVKSSDFSSADDVYLETEITFDSETYMISGVETDSSGLCKILRLVEQYG